MIKNLTEAEEKEFYRLVGKMNGEELDKEQDTKVKKPEYGDVVFHLNYVGEIRRNTWLNTQTDSKMWELGNIFFTEEEAKFAREKKKVEVELQRYAEEHNGTASTNRCYLIRYEEDGKRLLCETWAAANVQGAVMFTSRDVLFDAIKAIGKDRILKCIFGVESEGE